MAKSSLSLADIIEQAWQHLRKPPEQEPVTTDEVISTLAQTAHTTGEWLGLQGGIGGLLDRGLRQNIVQWAEQRETQMIRRMRPTFAPGEQQPDDEPNP
jgi:hypothetical protein